MPDEPLDPEKYALPEAYHRMVFAETIVPNELSGLARDLPTVLLLAGQTGAGKSRTKAALITSLNLPTAVEFGSDTLRNYHPTYPRLLQQMEETVMQELTLTYTGPLHGIDELGSYETPEAAQAAAADHARARGVTDLAWTQTRSGDVFADSDAGSYTIGEPLIAYDVSRTASQAVVRAARPGRAAGAPAIFDEFDPLADEMMDTWRWMVRTISSTSASLLGIQAISAHSGIPDKPERDHVI